MPSLPVLASHPQPPLKATFSHGCALQKVSIATIQIQDGEVSHTYWWVGEYCNSQLCLRIRKTPLRLPWQPHFETKVLPRQLLIWWQHLQWWQCQREYTESSMHLRPALVGEPAPPRCHGDGGSRDGAMWVLMQSSDWSSGFRSHLSPTLLSSRSACAYDLHRGVVISDSQTVTLVCLLMWS